MTLADPTADMEGVKLTIASQTAAAHTVTLTTGFLGSNASDVFTFVAAVGESITLLAGNSKWHHVSSSLAADESVAVPVA